MAENNPEKLMMHEHLVYFLYRWTRWGNEDKVIKWLKDQTESVEGCINLLKRFVSKSSSQAMGDYVAKINIYIKLENIENFIAIEPIATKINNIDDKELDPQAKEAIKAFKDALGKREKGVTDDW